MQSEFCEFYYHNKLYWELSKTKKCIIKRIIKICKILTMFMFAAKVINTLFYTNLYCILYKIYSFAYKGRQLLKLNIEILCSFTKWLDKINKLKNAANLHRQFQAK